LSKQWKIHFFLKSSGFFNWKISSSYFCFLL
jgi:hypothetical protein